MKLKALIFFSLLLFSLSFVINKKATPNVDLDKYVFDPGDFKSDLRTYDQGTSVVLAKLSAIAYCDSNTIKKIIDLINEKYHKNLKFIFLEDSYKGKFWTKTTAHFLLVGTKEYIIGAFRGSHSRADWIADLKQKRYVNVEETEKRFFGLPPAPGGFRAGVMALLNNDRFNTIDDFIIKDLKGTKSIPFILTGHSLGAAEANLFVIPLINSGHSFAGMYSFAPPNGIDKLYADSLRKGFGKKLDPSRIYDIINYKDYVPRAGLNANDGTYGHFGRFMMFCKDSILSFQDEDPINLGIKGNIKAALKYHPIETYIKNLSNPKNSTELVNARLEEKSAPCKIE